MQELGKPEPDASEVQKVAAYARCSLRTLSERWYFTRLANTPELLKLSRDLLTHRDRLRSTGLNATDHAGQVIDLLQRAVQVAPVGDQLIKMEVDEIRQIFDQLTQSMEAFAAIVGARLPISEFDEKLGAELKLVADYLRKSCLIPPISDLEKNEARAKLQEKLLHPPPIASAAPMSYFFSRLKKASSRKSSFTTGPS